MVYAVKIENLVKKYDTGTVAVDGISLSIEKGEFFGFLGPNGAGKTTTIHCITGVARITSGTISVFGIDVVKDYRKARTKVGIAPQEFNIDIFGKVGKLLDYIGGYYGMRKQERKKRIAELLEQFNLTQYKDTAFQHLSGGFKRRVILARALVHDPEILILDEPTAGVDVELRHELWRDLKKLNKEGKTIILTSHYLEEVELLCNRIAIINKGKIVEDGSKEHFTRDGKSLEDHYLEITRRNDKD
ncbi:ABC transporter ATP-binding protein [Patescibacteria group bacterium]|nr:ABC transporter ATP-binding protein [Patescibacteria group bacterium]